MKNPQKPSEWTMDEILGDIDTYKAVVIDISQKLGAKFINRDYHGAVLLGCELVSAAIDIKNARLCSERLVSQSCYVNALVEGCFSEGDLDLAGDWFRKAVKYDPDFGDVVNPICDILHDCRSTAEFAGRTGFWEDEDNYCIFLYSIKCMVEAI